MFPPPSTPALTPDGIRKLLRLTGKLHKTDVTVQILPRACAKAYSEEHNASISDGCQLLPAIIDVRRTKEQIDELILGVHKIKAALICPFPSGEEGFCNTLVIASLEKCTEAVPGIIGRSLDSLEEVSFYQDENFPTENTIPISALHFIFRRSATVPYIRALVTFKSRLFHRTDPEGIPDSFVIHLMDETSEVLTRATGGILAEEVYDRLQMGKVYNFYDLLYTGSFEKGSCYFNLKDKSQLSMTKCTVFEEVLNTKPLQYRFKFVPIPRLKEVKLNTVLYSPSNPSKKKRFNRSVDMIGIVKEVSLISERSFYQRSIKLPFREVTMFDQSGTDLVVRLWSYNAEEFIARPGDIVAFRNAHLFEHPIKLSEDEHLASSVDREHRIPHRILSVTIRSTVHLEPEVEERFALRSWHNLTQESLTIGIGSGACDKKLDTRESERENAFTMRKICAPGRIDILDIPYV